MGFALTAQIIVANGGSKDDSRELAERASAEVVDADSVGYGGTLLAGFDGAKAPSIDG